MGLKSYHGDEGDCVHTGSGQFPMSRKSRVHRASWRGAACVALSWGVGFVEEMVVAVAYALAPQLVEAPSRHPLCPQLSQGQCHWGDAKWLHQLLGSSRTSVAPVLGNGHLAGTGAGLSPELCSPLLCHCLSPPASCSPLGACGALLTYSPADLKRAMLILLENALCPSVGDRHGHSPVLQSQRRPWGVQAAAALAWH